MAVNPNNSYLMQGAVAGTANNATKNGTKGANCIGKASETNEPLPLVRKNDDEKTSTKDVTENDLKKTAADLFREIDGDRDLHITEQEFTDAAVTEYEKNGKQIPKHFSSIGSFLMNLVEKFRRFAGSDGEMNIDEFNAYQEEEKSTMQAEESQCNPKEVDKSF